jgi:ribosome production factor 2
MEAREPKEVEDPRTVIFVRGTRTGEVVKGAMKDLVRGLRSNDYICIIKQFFLLFFFFSGT